MPRRASELSIWHPGSTRRRIATATFSSAVLLLGGSVHAQAVVPLSEPVSTTSSRASLEIAVAKRPIWVARYVARSDNWPHAMKVSPDGRTIFVTGSSGLDYATVAYEATSGAQLWSARYHEPSGGVSSPVALGVSSDGRFVYATGSSDGGVTNDDYVTIGYDATTGKQIWLQRYNGSHDAVDTATSLDVSPDSSVVYVTGFSEVFGTKQFVTFAYDGLTGDILWVAHHKAAVGIAFDSVVLRASPDGTRVLVSGGAQRGNVANYHVDYVTLSYEAGDGTREWIADFDGSSHLDDLRLAIDTSPNGDTVFVTGEATAGPSWDYATVAYQAQSGARLWVSTYGDPQGGADVADAIGVAPDGRSVYVTGESFQENRDFDAVTLAYDASSGQQQWMTRSGKPGVFDDLGFALTVSSDGARVYVAGCAGGEDYYLCDLQADLSTWAYDAGDGAELWHAEYTVNPDGTNFGQAIATSPTGSMVYVTGLSDGVRGTPDFATLAYSG